MKKENRKLAKERKAKERKKSKQLRLLKKGLLIGGPIVLFLLLILILSSIDNQDSANQSTTTGTASDTATDTSYEEFDTSILPDLNTDPGLVVEDGDTVNIDYVGTIDGVEFLGGSTGGAGTDLTIGSHLYIDDFEQQLIGYNVGDTVEVVVTFPDDYGRPELNGKEAVFTTVINGIYK